MVPGISKYRLNSNAGVMALALTSILMAWMAARYEYSLIPLIIAGAAAVAFTVLATLKNPFQGLLINLAICFFIFIPQRVLGLPYSIALIWEIHLVICFFAAMLSMKGSRLQAGNIGFFRNPITVMMIVYFLYIILQYFNPNVPNSQGWLYFMRRALSFVFIFFSAYYILDDLYKIKRFLQLMVGLIFLATAYAYWQQMIGLPSWDENYINQSSIVYNLHVQWGLFRKFSFLDVVTFPMIANVAALILVIFALFEKRKTRLWLYLVAALIMLVGATFSGTRSASYIFPAGLLLYTVVNISKPKTILIYAGVIAAIFLVINLPIHRFNTLNRFRSSFTSDDASLEVRNINRARIQPYIYEHPIGGGLMSTGAGGEKYYPSHPLAKFPPDSGLLASALEKGWIGLAIDLLFYLLIMIEGTRGYFRTQNETHKKYYLALTCGIFSLVLAEYAQVVIPQIPICTFFMSTAAIIVRLRQLDKQPETLLIKSK
ncbi:MAG TPA: O-antigen ligase family protein [Chitinophagaceae bacterium]|nr:O-antigen ligase family protein [Chitinophagaceae bacterium]